MTNFLGLDKEKIFKIYIILRFERIIRKKMDYSYKTKYLTIRFIFYKFLLYLTDI